MLEKGFVLGASHDGTIYYRKTKNEYGLEIDQKSDEWLETVQKNLQKAYKKKSRIRKTKRGYFRINVYSKDIYSELQKFRENPRFVLKQNKDFQKGFLQGIFDAEGSIRLERNHITVSSNNNETIAVITKILNNFGIVIGKPFKDKNNVISVPFYGKENLVKFKKFVDFRHPEKKQRLESLINRV